MNINDCLSQIVALTQQNVEILTALNDSFYTKRSHIAIDIDGKDFAIPSFLSLENKIDILQQDLENIINAPKTGEAFTYFDGTTQKLELSGYASTPSHVDLEAVEKFGVSDGNIFKDFMTPSPYVRLDITSIPNNIKHVNVRKIIIKNDELRALIDDLTNIDSTASATISYASLYKILYNFEDGVDYILYDTTKRLPFRVSGAYGNYSIKSITDNYQDSNFDEHYELVLDQDLTYTIANGTIVRNIIPGDHLITNNDKVQMIVEDVFPGTRTVKVRILFGGYANLCDSASANPDLYKLKFYKTADWDKNKYIEEPLEEDQYICVFVAPVNDTTNIQAPWGVGLYINTDYLVDEDGQSFREYYKKYVNNVGDALFAITHMMDDDAQIEKLNAAQFDILREYRPTILNENQDNIIVTQINKHLNDSKSVQTIRNLYNQKSEYKNQLSTIQDSINNINQTLAAISFDDTTNTRTTYEDQLAEYNAKKREITASILSIVNEISENANSSDVPIENAKYHIRGFIDVNDFEIDGAYEDLARIIRLDVEYRYKNKSKFSGNAETIGDEYIYSDWNKMDSIQRKITPQYINNGFVYALEPLNQDQNLISFNQLDIPISQGESVDIRVRFVYNLGYPFVEFTSDWSDIYNVSFPDEYLTDIEILDIIGENNEDIKKNQYLGMMEQYGLIEHASDLIQDQTIKYFHTPEHIASGFYTEERRIIPLKDKLQDIVGNLTDLQIEVYGAISDNLVVTVTDGISNAQIKPAIVNTFRTISYDNNNLKVDVDDSITGIGKDAEFAYSQLMLTLQNTGDYTIKLHSIFPGDFNVELLPDTAISKYDVNDYLLTDDDGVVTGGVYMQFDEDITGNQDYVANQRLNQFMYFRTKVPGVNALYKVDAPDIMEQDALQENIKMSINPLLGTDQIALELRSAPFIINTDSSDEIRFKNTAEAIIKRGKMKFTEHKYNETTKQLELTNTSITRQIRRSAFLLPYPGTLSNICIPNSDSFIAIEPGSSIKVPLSFYYWFDEDDVVSVAKKFLAGRSVTRSISFDIRTSLFAEPVNYKLNVVAYKTDTASFIAKSIDDVKGLTSYTLTPKTEYKK